MKKVTIMIPTYNQAKYISKAIKSALNIDYPNIEVIVSDDCSTDNTEEVISKYLEDNRFKYIKNEKNLGRVGNYRKTLYEYSSGDYVLNLDGDDWLLDTNFISKAIELFEKNDALSCVLGDRQNYNESTDSYKTLTNKNNPYIKTIMDGNDFFINMPKIKFIFSHLACIYKRELALNLDFYSHDILSSDSESICKLYINQKVGYLPITVGVWRVHEANASHKDLEKKLENTKKYTYLYDFVINKNIFKKETLDKWLIINQSGILAQDFFYYMKNKKFIMAFQIIIKASKINTKLPFAIINKIFRRGLKLING